MKVFDDFQREDFEDASYTDALFTYLNNSARPVFEEARTRIEEWFSIYPKSHQSELRSRLRSNDDHNCEAAIFELMLHQLLINLSCSVEIHPSLERTTRSPDFFATSENGDSFYLEATLATYESPETLASQARINQVFDTIKRRVDSTIFFLDLEIRGAPRSQPPSRRLADDLDRWLANLDPDEVGRKLEQEGFKNLPIFHFTHDGWHVAIRPIPKKKSKRGLKSKSPIGMVETGWKSVDHRTHLRNALESKASSYGDLDHPFVLAVNCLEHIDDIDIMEALFGKENWLVSIDPNDPDQDPDANMHRTRDGFWTAKSGPEYTRITAVLLFQRFKVWDIQGADVRLYHNPWAKKSYSSSLCNLPQAIPGDDRMVKVDGKPLSDLLR